MQIMEWKRKGKRELLGDEHRDIRPSTKERSIQHSLVLLILFSKRHFIGSWSNEDMC